MNNAGPQGGDFLRQDEAKRLLKVMDYLATHHHQVWSNQARSDYEWAIRRLTFISTTDQ